MASRACKDCHAPIDFIQLENGRWKPVRPGTREFHRCKLEQTCGDCGNKFEGAPWMKTCPTCFKNSRPGREGFQPPRETGNFGEPTRRAKTEPLRMQAGHDDDNFGEGGAPFKHDDGFDDIPF